MGMIIPLASLGFASAIFGEIVGTPLNPFEKTLDRHAILERKGSATAPLLDYYRYKRYYRHDQNRAPGKESGQIQSPRRRDPDGVGTSRPETPEPVVRRRSLREVAM